MAEMSGQEIYDNFHNGVGAEGLATGAAMVQKIAARYRERAVEIHQLVGEMESAWQGAAADRGQRGAGPLLTEHETASHHFSVSEDLNDRQSGSFFRARNSVVPVPPAPGDVPAWGPLSPDWVPYEQRVQEHNAAARHNVDVMNSYSGASAYNTDNLPSSYGELANDQAGAVVDEPDTITVGDTEPGTGGPHGSEPRDSGSRDSGPLTRPDSGANGPVNGPNIDAPPPNSGQEPDSTTPGGYSPTPSPGTALPTTDFGSGRPALTGSGPMVGTGVIGYGPGGVRGGPGEFGSPRGGGPAGGLVPRGLPGGGAEPQAVRSASASVARNVGAGMSAVPVGAGRGRDEEDAERKAPAYLEGGDPEDLFGSELLTAPPVIGEEDED